MLNILRINIFVSIVPTPETAETAEDTSWMITGIIFIVLFIIAAGIIVVGVCTLRYCKGKSVTTIVMLYIKN